MHTRAAYSHLWTAVFFSLISLSLPLTAQESIRMSLVGAAAADARRQASSSAGYYNIMVGPTAWRFSAGLGAEFTDNAEASNASEGDLILTPSISTQMLWPVTEQNRLDLSISGGYRAYVEHSTLSRFYLAPGSELSFDVYLGDVKLNFHDRFSINEETYQDPTVVGIGDYSQFQNTIGVGALWDLNKVVLRLGYDHATYIGLTGNRGTPDGQSEIFSASGGYTVRPGMELGVEAGAGFNNYDSTGATNNAAYTDATFWNVGPYVDAKLTDYLSGRLSIGYTSYIPKTEGLETFGGMYGQLALTDRLNRFVDVTLSGGRSISFGYAGGTTDTYFVNLGANWQVVRKFTLTTTFAYNHGTYIFTGGETYDWFGPSVALSRAITRKLTANLAYQFYARTSNQSGRDYTANTVSLQASYQF